MDKKFIVTTDKSVADKLSVAGFVLMSQIGDTYTFMNNQKNFNFSDIGKGKIHYTNILSL